MSGVVEIKFGNSNKDQSSQNITKKVYSKGNIVVSIPQTSTTPYKIISIKNYNPDDDLKQYIDERIIKKKLSPPKTSKPKYKSIKKSVKEMVDQIYKEMKTEDPDAELKKNVGYILRNTFTEEELKDNFVLSKSPTINQKKEEIQKKEETKRKEEIQKKEEIKKKEEIQKNNIKNKVKPYIPETKVVEHPVIDERYLKRTINIFQENLNLVKQINDVLEKSIYINEEKKKEKCKN